MAKKKKKSKVERRRRKARLEKLGDKARERLGLPDAPLNLDARFDVKMSERLIQFAQPLLALCPDDQSKSFVLSLAVVAWNLSFVDDEDEREAQMEAFLAAMNHPDKKMEEQVRGNLTLLIKRKFQDYPGDRRFIVEHKILKHKGDVRVNCLFTVLEKGTEKDAE